jgi:aerobic carbon-monoxide dehydrogenase large subunit
VPGFTEVPDIRVEHMETASPYTEFGVKGIGEGGAIAPAAALCNAINGCAASAWGVVSDAPITPRRIQEAIQAAKAAR